MTFRGGRDRACRYQFRTFVHSLLALLRMAVGDFDYRGLESSHYLVGPAMFWLYIFLMFFILMSVFIALIAESYEKAKQVPFEPRGRCSHFPAGRPFSVAGPNIAERPAGE